MPEAPKARGFYVKKKNQTTRYKKDEGERTVV